MRIIPADHGQRVDSQRASMDKQALETKEVESPSVACDGDGGSLGHPRVFLTFDETGEIECPYCSRRFVLKKGAKKGAH